MALIVADRVQQTGTANTTVSFTLSGSVTGFQSFSVVGNNNTTYYAATDGAGNWEVGVGTYSTTGPTLTRTTVLASSNSGSAVTFSGTVNVFVTYPAGRNANLNTTDTVPSAANSGATQFWYDSTNGVLLVYYNGQWVEDYQSQLDSVYQLPDMNGGTASTTSWTYWINCGGAT